MSQEPQTAKCPIFVSGRQHSGNTVTALLLGRIQGVYSQVAESVVLEQHHLLDRDRDPASRARRLTALIDLEAEDHREWLADHLAEAAIRAPDTPTLTLYRDAMDAVSEHMSCHRWAQKGTSYIFYAKEILERIPDSKLLYMLRNPWDLAASRRRRNHRAEAILSTMLGWSRGSSIAEHFSSSYPDRFRVLRYEDLTGRPAETVRDLCEWIGEPYDDTLLDIPHVNPAENKYALESTTRGLNTSRIFQYADRLMPYEIAAMDLLVKRYGLEQTMARWYPELPHTIGVASTRNMKQARKSLRAAPLRYAWFYLTRIKRSPTHLISRTWRRLRGERA